MLVSLFVTAQSYKTIVYETNSISIKHGEYDWSDRLPINAFVVLDENNISIIGNDRLTFSMQSGLDKYVTNLLGYESEVVEALCIDDDGSRCLVQFVYVEEARLSFMLINYADKAVNYSLDKVLK